MSTQGSAPQKKTGAPKAALVLGSAVLIAFIGMWEGENENTVYADKLAQGLPTVCKGLTRHVTKTPIIVGEYWPPEKCHEEETRAITVLQLQLLKCFAVTPPQSVFDAATSHAWNNGIGATCNSLAMHSWNMEDWTTGCRRLVRSDSGKPVWSYVKTGKKLANGKPEYRFVQGLANRRQSEYELCIKEAPR